MTEDLSVLSLPEFKGLVQDMQDLLSQSRLAFLLGAGCSKSAGLPLMAELTDIVLKDDSVSSGTANLLGAVKGLFSGAASTTIEDYMSEIVDFLCVAERRARCGATQSGVLVGEQEWSAAELQTALREMKKSIASAIGGKEVSIAVHQQFIRAIHSSLQAGKKARGVDYFILNYDTLVEDALGLERVVYCDGFTGAATAWWEPAVFENSAATTRVFKIHGSIDWCLLADDSLPRRVRSGLRTESSSQHVLIYPAATKYQEAQRDPFAQMLRHMRKSLHAHPTHSGSVRTG